MAGHHANAFRQIEHKQARRLGIAYQTLYGWVTLAKKGKLASVDAKRVLPVSPVEAELSRLKKEVAVLREERDILKKVSQEQDVQ